MRKPSRRTLLAGVAAAFVSPPILAQSATRQKVTAALPKLEQFIRQVVDRKLVPGLSIAVVHRDEAAGAIAHRGWTELHYVIEGSGTMVTGQRAE